MIFLKLLFEASFLRNTSCNKGIALPVIISPGLTRHGGDGVGHLAASAVKVSVFVCHCLAGAAHSCSELDELSLLCVNSVFDWCCLRQCVVP